MSSPELISAKRWRLWGLAFAIAYPTCLTAVYFVGLAACPAGWQQGACTIGKVLQFAFPLIWVRWVLTEPVRSASPARHAFVLNLSFGALVMLAMLVLANYWLLPRGYLDGMAEVVRRKITDLGIHTPLRYIAVGIFYVAVHSFLEEYFWRWFVFGQLRRAMPLVPAVAISSLGFMAHHVIFLGVYFGWNSPATYTCSLAVAIGGAVWAWLYERSGSLLGIWLSHALVDAGIFILGFQLGVN